ncbi:TonB-dependent receptor [Paraglaciecola sp. L1A13]|uniref:TonB-dependent receptor n=1 Tax=Paraglaciecola sp. L1A13 TaxID=2686359 RepID=UPI00131A8A43|nr:TonB-dependent receptor [Paraglaciecola sp. L1A13]
MDKIAPPKFIRNPIAVLVTLSLGLTIPIVCAQEIEEEVETLRLETITVKAQKRKQNMQAVPVSVSAISGKQMTEAVLQDVFDVTAGVPASSAFQTQNVTNSSFSIRGIGTSSQNFGLESSVGLYVDGVYRARQSSMVNNLVDIEAVEVLRGPQGTLFGKNTPSGAMLIRTVAPDHIGANNFVEATVGNYGLVNYSGAASISAIDNVLAFRFTGFGSQRDGFVSDVNFGDDVLNDRDRWGGRLQALYTPNKDVSVRIIADYSEIDEVCCAAPVQMSNAKATGIEGKFGSDSLLSQAPFNATIFDGDDFFEREVALSFLPESSMKDRGLSAEINWNIDKQYTLVSISAYRNFDSVDNIDSDFTDADLFGTRNDSQQRSFSQELRIDYNGENMSGILGAYYFHQNLDLDYSLYTGEQFNEFFLSGFAQGAFNDLLAGIDSLSASTNGLIAASAAPAPAFSTFDHIAKQTHESYAIFGQVDYQLTEKFTLTAGLRYTDESKDLSTVFTENLADDSLFPTFFTSVGDPENPTSIVPDTLLYGAAVAGNVLTGIQTNVIDITSPEGQAALTALTPFQSVGWGFNPLGAITANRSDIADSLSDDQVTGTLKLSYFPDRNTLLYASYGTGYKSGGTNTDRIAEGFDPIFGAETSRAFELGLKKDFPAHDLRVNVAVHSTVVDDIQASTFTGTGFNLQNAGDYKTSGLEIELTWLPTDTVQVDFVYARVNAEYDNFMRGNCWTAYTWHTGIADPGQESTDPAAPNPYCDRSGDRPGGEPEDYAMIKVKKDFAIRDDINAYVVAEFSYTGDIVLDGSNDPFAVQDSYNLLNLRFFMNFEKYDMDLVFWGRNVLDEEYLNHIDFNTPLQEGKLNAYISDPATFGVTLHKRF